MLDRLKKSVQKNCDISDSRYAGNYTMCVYLLKMREYYRWQKGLDFAEKLSMLEVGEWLGVKEEQWEEEMDSDWSPVIVNQSELGLFDDPKINQKLSCEQLVYSSGLGRFGKPIFFLGKCKEVRTYADTRVFVVGDELARELAAPPAMSRDNEIFIRFESLKRMLFEMIQEWSWQKRSGPMAQVVKQYGCTQDLQKGLQELASDQVDVLVQHELGEIQAGKMLGENWNPRLQESFGSNKELMLRSSRDNLADCLAVLPTIVESENRGLFNFYIASLTPLRKKLFPTLQSIYSDWKERKSIDQMLEKIEIAEVHWLQTCQRLIDDKNFTRLDSIDDFIDQYSI